MSLTQDSPVLDSSTCHQSWRMARITCPDSMPPALENGTYVTCPGQSCLGQQQVACPGEAHVTCPGQDDMIPAQDSGNTHWPGRNVCTVLDVRRASKTSRTSKYVSLFLVNTRDSLPTSSSRDAALVTPPLTFVWSATSAAALLSGSTLETPCCTRISKSFTRAYTRGP